MPRFFDSRVALHLKYKVVDEVCRALALAKASRSWCVSRENEPSRAREQGFAMIATLMVVVILGILVTIVLTQAQSPKPSPSSASASQTTTTAPQTIAQAVPPARLAACEADFASVQTAISTYQALNGAAPGSGTAWATSASNGGPFMASWPSGSPSFSISWDGTQLSVFPEKGVASHGSYGTSSPATGCFSPS